MSMSFEEVAELKPGQVFYENDYGQSVKFKLVGKPFVNGDCLEFTGECEHGEVDFLINRKYTHYGPDISLEPEYVNIEEVEKWV